jgi:hypothetical protein
MVITAKSNVPVNSNAPVESKKRNYAESFGERDYETERYGQEISPDFFATEYGHAVIE